MSWLRQWAWDSGPLRTSFTNVGPIAPGTTVGPIYLRYQLTAQQVWTTPPEILLWPESITLVAVSAATYGNMVPPATMFFDPVGDPYNPAFMIWDFAEFGETAMTSVQENGGTTGVYENAAAPRDGRPVSCQTKRALRGDPATEYGWLQVCFVTANDAQPDFGWGFNFAISALLEPTKT